MYEVMKRLNAVWNFFAVSHSIWLPSTDAPLHLMGRSEWCHVMFACEESRGRAWPKPRGDGNKTAVLNLTSGTWRHRECAADNVERGSVIATSLPRL